MAISTVTHLNFTGNARAALEYYHAIFGGQLVIGTYGEGGVPQDSADSDRVTFAPVPADSPNADLVGFGLVAAENGFRIAAYDVFDARGGVLAGADGPGRADALVHTESLFVLLNGDSLEEVAGYWTGLADGGRVIQSLAPTPWGTPYGMVTDRFGVTWIVGVNPG
ncbi:VOC family protein [Actinomycetospora sp. NBRC 106378]|uniref:VOC family protein n=1 Tax=Actinomycetospora sp. NBRC 106378 TaxID=3032208 RepID=UPI0024A5D963|nr:VOC family protein [Actinomycetospora sp. NBRC 106378]GLZ51601.1 VOC family protein [Actinomycetospora sp. NBRC 106378]